MGEQKTPSPMYCMGDFLDILLILDMHLTENTQQSSMWSMLSIRSA